VPNHLEGNYLTTPWTKRGYIRSAYKQW